MGNGIFTCKTCNEICPGKTRIEINNNVYANNSEIKLDDKSKSEQRIITNSFNPNYKCEFSGDSNINQNDNYHNIKNNTNMNNKKENTFDNSIIEEEEPQIIITENVNDGKNEKMIGNSPSNSLTGSNYNLSNSKNLFHNYNIEMINYLNKLRKTPKLVIKDIEHIIKHNVKKTDDKDKSISYQIGYLSQLKRNKQKQIQNLEEQVLNKSKIAKAKKYKKKFEDNNEIKLGKVYTTFGQKKSKKYKTTSVQKEKIKYNNNDNRNIFFNMANNDKNNTINNKENNELFDIENLLQKKMQSEEISCSRI